MKKLAFAAATALPALPARAQSGVKTAWNKLVAAANKNSEVDVPSHTDGGLRLLPGQKYLFTNAEKVLKEKEATRRLIREWRPG